jgi:DUF1680 family protein
MAVLCQDNNISAEKIHPQYLPFLREISKLQCPDGHFGDPNIDWDGKIDVGTTSATFTPKYLPTLWGNSRILCGLVESYQVTKDEKILQSAVKLGDFYIKVSHRLTDPQKVAEFIGISVDELNEAVHNPEKRGSAAAKLDTYAGGYGTCFFPAIESLVKLYEITNDKKYLDAADKMAVLYAAIDVTKTAHTHGMVCTYYGMLLLSQKNGKQSYLDQAEKRWDELTEGGFVNPAGGLSEGIANGISPHDEGCTEMDWLRLNLKLYEMTGKTRYLDMADRLIHNHYLANQWSTGGFGHRYLLSDKIGSFGFGKGVAEAVWCCDFHGTLGFSYYKQSLFSKTNDTSTINFAENFEVKNDDIAFVSEIKYADNEAIQTLKFSNHFNGILKVRIPDWAESVTLKKENQIIETEISDGFTKTKSNVSISKTDNIAISYNKIQFTEDRLFHKINLSEIPKGESKQVVFRRGQFILTARNITAIPTYSSSINLIPFGSGTEKETAVFVFDAVSGD